MILLLVPAALADALVEPVAPADLRVLVIGAWLPGTTAAADAWQQILEDHERAVKRATRRGEPVPAAPVLTAELVEDHGEPIQHAATVQVTGPVDASCTTGTDSDCVIGGLPAGTYQVTASFSACKRGTNQVTVVPGTLVSVPVEIYCEPTCSLEVPMPRRR